MISSPKPLEGLLVVAVEQAVAAPYCSSRLADAGARVIKVERPEGDFARGYDRTVHGESSYFVWINRGKESIALDLKATADLALLERMIARADVFIQNLAPGAARRMGLGSPELRARHPQLRTRPMPVGPSVASVPAAPWQVEWDPDTFAPAPRIDEHGAALRTEFSETATI